VLSQAVPDLLNVGRNASVTRHSLLLLDLLSYPLSQLQLGLRWDKQFAEVPADLRTREPTRPRTAGHQKRKNERGSGCEM